MQAKNEATMMFGGTRLLFRHCLAQVHPAPTVGSGVRPRHGEGRPDPGECAAGLRRAHSPITMPLACALRASAVAQDGATGRFEWERDDAQPLAR